MKIVLDIRDNGNIICMAYNKDIPRYESFSNYLPSVLKSIKHNNNIRVFDDVIEIDSKNNVYIIENYSNNNDKTLKEIIDSSLKINEDNKRKKYRGKVVRRVSVIGVAGVILLGVKLTDLNEPTEIYSDDTSTITNIQNDDTYQETFSYLGVETKEESNNNDSINYEIDYENRTNEEKYINTKEKYYDIIEKYSNMYGIDPRIMLAIATQESGVHRTDTNGPAIGLMQIELSVWDGSSISAYNYETNSNETIDITKEKLKDLDFNVKTSCMIFQDCLKKSDFNLEVAIQMYNYGEGNVLQTFRYYYGYDVSLKYALSNYDSNWLNYRQYINQGDKDYLEHVLSYIEDVYDLKCMNMEEIITFSFNNNIKTI